MPHLRVILQESFDVRKYEDSRVAGGDTCGTYDFCTYCNKKNKYPCGQAMIRHKEGEANVNE